MVGVSRSKEPLVNAQTFVAPQPYSWFVYIFVTDSLRKIIIFLAIEATVYTMCT